MSARKPHSGNAGYVCELKARLGGHIVIYDRDAGCEISADNRWIVMHEPSSLHVAVHSLRMARDVMKGVARARTIDDANGFAQIIPQPSADHSVAADDDGAEVSVRNERKLKRLAEDAAARAAGLERFLADPENEPSEEGKAGLRIAFGLGRKS